MNEFLEQHFESIRDMFFTLGIKSVSMDNISSGLGVSKRTLYEKFDDKNHLVNEIFFKDFYDFKDKVKLIHENSPDAIHETYFLLKLVKEKQYAISVSTLSDLRKYHYSVNNEIAELTGQLLLEALVNTIKRGITESNFRKDVEPVEIASLITFIFNSFIMTKEIIKPEELFFLTNDLLDYLIKSICNQQGKIEWDKLKNGINS